LKRVKLVLVLIFVAAVSLNVVTIDKNNYKMTLATSTPSKTVVLDAGHGGFDGGAVSADGTAEKNINLNITLMVANILRQAGYSVILTREADVSTDDVETEQIAVRKKSDLRNRLSLMKDYPGALFVSIHLNKFTTTAANGSQVFYSPKTEGSRQLSESIQSSIINLLQPYNTRVCKKATSSTYILYNATIPAVLVECGFLSNKAELEKLKQPDYQAQMAFCIAKGIIEFEEEKNQ
jgi:N-acetylmuramoyl-L-alanine amidase